MPIFIARAAAQTAPQSPALQAGADRLQELKRAEAQLLTQQAAEPASAPWWDTHNAMTVSVSVLVFAAVTMLIAAYLIRKESDSQVILRVMATIMIVNFTVFLIIVGYTDQQIAPAMGLLGTIAGYLLGKDATGSRNTGERTLGTGQGAEQGNDKQP